jgi:hypothetical protein
MKKYILIIAVALAAGFSGCKKGYLDLSDNPNSPSTTTPQLALAGGLNYAVSIEQGGTYSEFGVWAGYQTTSGGYVPNSGINQYQFGVGAFSGDFSPWYQCLLTFDQLKTIAPGPTYANFQAIAMIMEAYGFQSLVDNYNNVPYSQALNPNITTPKYDDGHTIYEALGPQLDAAIKLIQQNPGALSPANSDIMFGGNMTNWIKFANSLKLRLAMRLSTKFPNDPLINDLKSTESLGYLDGTVEGAVNPGYTNLAGKENIFYGTYGYDQNGDAVFGNLYYRANATSVDSLAKFNDPRKTQIYALTQDPDSPATAKPNIVRGNIFGDPHALGNSTTSSLGPGLLKSPSQNAYLFLSSESLFLQAEAAYDGYITGNAQSLYEAGITASFVELGLTPAQATTYYSQTLPNVNWAASKGNIEEAIIVQKWIALNSLFDFEAYNEYRRTGYPLLPSSIDPAAISKTLPTRVFYPLSELQDNAANLQAQGTINQFTSKIFWAK